MTPSLEHLDQRPPLLVLTRTIPLHLLLLLRVAVFGWAVTEWRAPPRVQLLELVGLGGAPQQAHRTRSPPAWARRSPGCSQATATS